MLKSKLTKNLSWLLIMALIMSLMPMAIVGAEEPIKMVFNGKADMSGVQGQDNWWYKYAPLGQDTYFNYPHYGPVGEWWEGQNNFIRGRIRNQNPGGTGGEDSQQSGSAGDSARVFVAPYTGKLTISVADNSIDSDTGEIVRFRIYRNNDIIFPNAAYATANPEIVDLDWLVLGSGMVNYYQKYGITKTENVTTAPFPAIDLNVIEGEEIIFRVNKGSNDGSSMDDADGRRATNDGDKVIFVPVITYTEIGDETEPDPVDPPPEPKTVYDVRDVAPGNAQGADNWFYRYADLGSNNYRPMGVFRENPGNPNQEEWFAETAGVHNFGTIRTVSFPDHIRQNSGNQGDSARVFVAPYTGKITISMPNNEVYAGTASNALPAPNERGDIVRFRILKGNEVLFPNTSYAAENPDLVDLNWLVLGHLSTYYQDYVQNEADKRLVSDVFNAPFPTTAEVEVEEGDEIIFRVNKGSNAGNWPRSASEENPPENFDSEGRRSNNNGDLMYFSPIITYTHIENTTEPEPTPDPRENYEAEPIYLTDVDGNIANDAQPGEMVKAHMGISNNTDVPANNPLTGTLIFAVYSGSILHDITIQNINLNTEREVYSGDHFTMPENSSVKAIIWDSVNTMTPLLDTVNFPTPNDTSINGVVEFPGAFSDLNFEISKTGTRTYTHNATPENQYDWADAIEVFITSKTNVGGSDANNLGTNSNSPISAARWMANHRDGYYNDLAGLPPRDNDTRLPLPTKYILTIVDNYYIYSAGVHQIVYGTRHNVAGTGNAREYDFLIRSGSPSGFTWIGAIKQPETTGEGSTSAWVFDENEGLYKTVQTTENRIDELVSFDKRNLDRYGMPKPKYTKVPSLEECKETKGAFFQDGVTVYRNPLDEDNLDDWSLLYVAPGGILSDNIAGNRVWMYQNLGFMMGAWGTNVINGQNYWRDHGDMNTLPAETPTYYYFGCKFWRSARNAIGFNIGNTGHYNVYIFDSIAAYATSDGFNYHGRGSQVVEVNSISYNNGTHKLSTEIPNTDQGMTSNNASTTHDRMSILRVGGRYWNTEGSPMADVGDCFTISMGTEIYTSAKGDFALDKTAFWIDNRRGDAGEVYSPPINNKYIVDCLVTGYDTRYSIAATPETYILDNVGYQKIVNGEVGQHGGAIVLPEITWEEIKFHNWKEQ